MEDLRKTYYVTKDYSKFRRLKGNRDILEPRKAKLVKSIEAIGVMDAPILVNEKMEIIDGQGRFEALKSLDLPIPYIVQEGIGLKECQRMNVGQSNWSLKDYIMSYAEIGDNSYAYLLSLMERYSYLPVGAVIAIAKNQFGANSKAIKLGTFSLTEKEYADAIPAFNFLDDNLLAISKLPGPGELPTAFIALAWVYRNVECNKSRVSEVLYYNAAAFKPLTKRGYAYFLEDLTNFYNHNLTGKNKVSFDGIYKIKTTKEM